jgi:myo-inositol catabolism protein IolC
MTDTLLILAVDQRPWLTKALYGHTDEATSEQRAALTEGKHVVLDGLLRALAQRDGLDAGILVDAQLGPGVPERAKACGVPLAMPIEAGGREVYETDPLDLAAYLKHYQPDYTKVLVRYNVDGRAQDNEVQRARLKEAANAAHDAGTRFLFEILVPATPDQLAAVGGDTERYDHELRPELILRGMKEISAEVDVDVWKLEHLAEPAHYRAANDLAAEHGATCILLGANADEATVCDWLATAAHEGFAGFAIGRSIWWDAMRGYLAGSLTRDQAVETIARKYLVFADAFLKARV